MDAQLWIGFEPVNHYTNEDVYEEIVAILEENNWEQDERKIVSD